ncbi:DUF2057 domain-containing protein [Photobacterium lipolyticum]|uniref:DUF2057 domain-containing protein n=1 Tax=Photobacterium lipolyticum TaxID=266810 RepID=A0A2T3N5A1_9GAMM|nr:DUF2057 domain-containing protein [Photobacterium lipolyticum]PSW07628.1 hypothetical protein C9I89_02670 [Photobacterium lipolyticum]
MKIKNIVTCSMISIFSLPIAADVKLELPKEVTVLSVNGKEGESGLLEFVNSSPDHINLPNGSNQIVYDVRKVYNKGSSQGKKYQSPPMVLSFNSIDSAVMMKVPQLNTLDSAREFDKKLTISLTDESGNSIEHRNIQLPINGFSINKNYSQLLESYNKTQIPQLKTVANSVINTTENKIKNNVSESSKLTILKDIFIQMEQEEKQEFLTWAINNIH